MLRAYCGHVSTHWALCRPCFNYYYIFDKSLWAPGMRMSLLPPLSMEPTISQSTIRKKKKLFSSFHCRLFIGMFYNRGRKTGDTTLQAWWLRSWVSTLGQAMKVAASPLSLQVMAQEPQSPCQAVGQSGEWVRANMFPWLLTQRCLLFSSS